MPGGNSETNKAEAYLAALRAGEELKTSTVEVPVTPAEEARAAAVEAIKKVELPTTRDIDKILGKVEVAPAPKIEEAPTDEIDAAAASIQERVIPVSEVPAKPEMMEQLQQPWMGKDMRAGSGNEGKDFPSRRKEVDRWARVIDGTAREMTPEPAVEIPVVPAPITEVPVSAPQVVAEVVPVQQVEAVPAVAVTVPEVIPELVVPKQETPVPVSVETPATIPPVEAIMMPPEKFVPLMTEDGGPEQDGEHRAPQYGTSNQETLDATQKAYSTAEGADIEVVSIQPEQVEADLAKGKRPEIPEIPKPSPTAEKAPDPAVEAPKKALRPSERKFGVPPKVIPAVEAPKEVSPEGIVPKDSDGAPLSGPVDGKSLEKGPKKTQLIAETTLAGAAIATELGRVAGEKLGKIAGSAAERGKAAGVYATEKITQKGKEIIDANKERFLQGMNHLSEKTQRFVRRLYLTGPVGAVMGVKWRMEFAFNDALTRFHGERASHYEGIRKEHTGSLAQVQAQQRELQQRLAEAAAAGGVDTLSKKVSRKAREEQSALSVAAIAHGRNAEVAGGKEMVWEKGYKKYEGRRDAAYARLQERANERIAGTQELVEKAEKKFSDFDGEYQKVERTLNDSSLTLERLTHQYAEIQSKGVKLSGSVREQWGENMRLAQEKKQIAEIKLQGYASTRAALSKSLDKVKEDKKKLRFERRQDYKVSETQYTHLEMEEAEAVRPWKWEEAFSESESVPAMRPEQLVEQWNMYFGYIEKVDPARFKDVAKLGDEERAVGELENHLAIYIQTHAKKLKASELRGHLAVLRSLIKQTIA